MTRRRLPILSALFLVSLIGASVYFLIPPRPGVTQENYHRLHKGMSKEEVESILGSTGEFGGELWGIYEYDWTENGCVLCLFFNEEPGIPGKRGISFGHFTGADGQREEFDESIGILEQCREWVRTWTGW